jgi:hypothetical protein
LTGRPLPEAPQPDKDGILTDEGETKCFTIRHMDAQIFARYCTAREKAASLVLPLRIIADDKVARCPFCPRLDPRLRSDYFTFATRCGGAD